VCVWTSLSGRVVVRRTRERMIGPFLEILPTWDGRGVRRSHTRTHWFREHSENCVLTPNDVRNNVGPVPFRRDVRNGNKTRPLSTVRIAIFVVFFTLRITKSPRDKDDVCTRQMIMAPLVFFHGCVGSSDRNRTARDRERDAISRIVYDSAHRRRSETIRFWADWNITK